MAEYHRVAKSGDVVAGKGTIVAVNELKIALFRVEGTVYAIRNQCAHMGGNLGDGSIEGDVVTCPDHGWPFSVKSGQHPQAPVVAVRTFAVREEGGEVYVEV